MKFEKYIANTLENNMIKKILVCGLPGAGKTTLSKRLAKALNAVHINADFVRDNINKDLGFSIEDRLENARRFKALCSIVSDADYLPIADFVCPTEETRIEFGAHLNDCFVIWMNTSQECSYADTKAMFVPPSRVNYEIKSFDYNILDIVRVLHEALSEDKCVGANFDTKQPTALFIGRYQPLHDGHLKLIREGIRRVGQAIIAIRNTAGLENNPFSYTQIVAMFNDKMKDEIQSGKLLVTPVPNITNIFYGRDVGYQIERIDLDEETQNISATKIRKEMGLQ